VRYKSARSGGGGEVNGVNYFSVGTHRPKDRPTKAGASAKKTLAPAAAAAAHSLFSCSQQSAFSHYVHFYSAGWLGAIETKKLQTQHSPTRALRGS
jgi:hypothetical protein